jgi:O-antigen/teichoic acid export membrane protein
VSVKARDPAIGRGFLKLGLGEAAARLISFGATVYLAVTVGAETYGMVVLATTMMAYAGRISDCGVDLLGVHDVAHDRGQLEGYLQRYTGARFLVASVLIVLIAAVGLLVFPQPDGAIVAAFAFMLAPMALGTRWAHLGLEHSGVVSLSRTITEVVAAAMILAFVRDARDVAVVPLAQILGESAAALLLLRALPPAARALRVAIRFETVKVMYRRSWSLVLNSMVGLVIFNIDFFFLRIYHDSATVGYYAAAYALVSFVLNVGNSYQLTLMPSVARAMSEPARERSLYHDALAQVFAGVFPIALGGCLVAHRLIPEIFGAPYSPAVTPLRILLWALPVALLRNVAQGVMIAHGRQSQMLGTSLLAAASNVALNIALIPVFGMTGAAIVTLVTESVRTIPMLWLLRRSGLPMPGVGRFWRTLLAAAAMAVAVVAAAPLPVWAVVPLGGLTYVAVMTLVGGVRFHRRRLPELIM